MYCAKNTRKGPARWTPRVRAGALVAALALIGAAVPAARADSVTITLQNDVSMLKSGVVTLWSPGTTPGTDPAALHTNIYIGEYQWQQTGTPSPLLGSQFGTFCIELPQGFAGGPTFTFDTSTPLGQSPVALPPSDDLGFGAMGPDRAALINELFAEDYAQVTTAATAAQFQIALWEAIYDFEYPTPYLSVTGISTTTADAWYANAVNDLAANGGVAPDANLVVLTNPTAQDQITVAAPLPKPSVVGLAILGLLGAARATRRLLA